MVDQKSFYLHNGPNGMEVSPLLIRTNEILQNFARLQSQNCGSYEPWTMSGADSNYHERHLYVLRIVPHATVLLVPPGEADGKGQHAITGHALGTGAACSGANALS